MTSDIEKLRILLQKRQVMRNMLKLDVYIFIKALFLCWFQIESYKKLAYSIMLLYNQISLVVLKTICSVIPFSETLQFLQYNFL
jgi:hypothetical protein